MHPVDTDDETKSSRESGRIFPDCTHSVVTSVGIPDATGFTQSPLFAQLHVDWYTEGFIIIGVPNPLSQYEWHIQCCTLPMPSIRSVGDNFSRGDSASFKGKLSGPAPRTVRLLARRKLPSVFTEDN
ncbi:hypothetical protein BaRGS_00009549 [Batillaria attramentaria]|uniref:Uncharacterized protein n=1 Tax=Batillaria attramentaria TaxID=370345 RepID=A0ABD0LIG0_9CAEN